MDVTLFTDKAWFPPRVTLIHKTQDCGPPIILTVCMKHPYMISRLKCRLRFPDVGPIFFMNTITQCALFFGDSTHLHRSDGKWGNQLPMVSTGQCYCLHISQTNAVFGENFSQTIISKNLKSPQLPDQNPPDIYLWGTAKSVVYQGRLITAFSLFQVSSW